MRFRTAVLLQTLCVQLTAACVLAPSCESRVAHGFQDRTQRLWFSDVRAGRVLRGDVEVLVPLPEGGRSQYGDYGLAVDGQEVSVAGTPMIEQNMPPVPATKFCFPTYDFPNGPHTLTLTDNKGRQRFMKVLFDNELFNLQHDSLLDSSLAPGPVKVRADLKTIRSWTITIDNDWPPNLKKARVYRGRSRRIAVAWDGLDKSGRDAPNDVYQIVIRVEGGPTINVSTNKMSAVGPRPASKTDAYPDRTTRAMVAGIMASDVDRLEFTGVQYMRFADNPIRVSDMRTVRRILDALRRATCRKLPRSNGINQLRIHMRPSHAQKATPILFHFNLNASEDCFGPAFHKIAVEIRRNNPPR